MAQKIEIKKTGSKTISKGSKAGRGASVKSERKTEKITADEQLFRAWKKTYDNRNRKAG